MEVTSTEEIEALRSEVLRLRRMLETRELAQAAQSVEQARTSDLLRAGVLLDSITDAFFGLDDEWRFAYLNPEAERLLDRSKASLLGKSVWEEYPLALGTAFEYEYRRARRERISVQFEAFYQPLDTWFEVRAYPLADGLAVYFHDVEERKRAELELQRRETELRTILDNVPVIVSSIDRKGRFRSLNSRFQEILGKDPEWALGRTLAEVTGEPHAGIARPYLERVMRGETVTFESMIRNHLGQLRDIRVFYTPQRDRTGSLDGLIAMVEDITEQKRSDAALRESEARFRSFFDMAAAGIALVDPTDGRFQQVNARFAEFLGYEVDELLELTYLDVTHPEEVEASRIRYQELVDGIGPASVQIEKPYVRKDGETVWGQMSLSVVRNDAGRPLYTVAVVEDVTQRRRSEQALRESEHRFRVMAESLPQLVWTCSPNGDCEYLSAQWVQYTGIPESDQLGLGWLSLVMHPEDQERTYQAWMAAVREEAPYDLEYRLRRHDGRYRWFKTRGTPMRDGSGQIVRWFGTCTDIHDQQEAEQERRFLLERERSARALAEQLNRVGPMLLTELDSQRLIQKVTDMATELVGAAFGSFFHNLVNEKGESYTLYTLSGAPMEAFSRFPLPRNTAVFAPTFAGEGVVLSNDITQDARYGRNAPYKGMPEGHLPVRSYLAAPVKSRGGEVLGGLFFGHSEVGKFTEQHARLVEGLAAQAAIALDNANLFTEARRSQLALKASNTELRRANADLEQFAYAAAHDLQEPLRMVTSYTQLLQRSLVERLDERTRSFMGYVVGGASRMSLLLQDLLAYTETSRAADPNERVALNRVLQQVLRNLEPLISETGAQIYAEALPGVKGREAHFVQLFQNLLSNALKYRRDGVQPTIRVCAELMQGRWLIRVQDNGIGIEDAYRGQVFGVFKRLHGSEIPGTGIGLAICQRVVERAGGEIWVDSKPGEGSTFCFTLPVLEPEDTAGLSDLQDV